MREVGVHLEDQVGAARQRRAKPARYARPSPSLHGPVEHLDLGQLGGQPVGDLAACRRASRRPRSGRGARAPAAASCGSTARTIALDVLGLVVGGEDEPGARHGARSSLDARACGTPRSQRHSTSWRPVRARRRRRLPGASPTATRRRRSASRASRWRSWRAQGRAAELPGVGKTIAEKIDALLETGSIPAADKLKAKYPGRPGRDHAPPRPRAEAGAQAVRRARRSTSLDELRAAAEQRAARATSPASAPRPRRTCSRRWRRGADGTAQAARRCCRARSRSADELVGRRCASTPRRTASSSPAAPGAWPTPCKDLDIVATAERPGGAGDGLRRAAADRRGAVLRRRRREGRDAQRASAVDLRIVPPEEASATCSSTSPAPGSHNEALRTAGGAARAARERVRGRRRRHRRRPHACATEEEVYELLGHAVHRAGAAREPGRAGRRRASTRAARADRAWTTSAATCTATPIASDGRNTIEEMAQAAMRARLRVPGDHRPLGHPTASATTSSRTSCCARSSAIRELNEKLDGLTLLAGTEVNVLPDGSLDYDDDVLERARLGRRQPAHLVPHGGEGDDRPHDRARWSTRSSTRSATPPAG